MSTTVGSGSVHRGSMDAIRGGARSPALPSPNTLLLRSLSSSSITSRVSSHFSHFNTNNAPVELMLPTFGRRPSAVADDDAVPARLGGGSGGVRRDGKSDAAGSSAALEARAARAKYLGADAGGGGGGTAVAGGGENAARAGKSKAQWGWVAGKSLFGKKAPVVDTGKKAVSESERVKVPPAEENYEGRDKNAGAGGAGAGGRVVVARSRDSLDLPQRRTFDGSRPSAESKTAADSRRYQGGQGGRQQQQQVGWEKDKARGFKTATTDQRPGVRGDATSAVSSGGGTGGADLMRVRDVRRARQGRSVESPGRIERGAADADTAAAAAHGFFSVPAAGYPDHSGGRDSGIYKRLKDDSEDGTPWDVGARDRNRITGSVVSTTGHASSFARVREQRLYGDYPASQTDDLIEFNRRRRGPRVVEVGTRGERVSSARPSSRSDQKEGAGRTRSRSQDRLDGGDRSRRDASQPWSDLASSTLRPPLPHPNASTDAAVTAGAKGTGRRGSGRINTAATADSPANSITTSEDNVAPGRTGTDEGTPSTGWGTSSLAGWGESMAAEAEAEVMGPRQHRGGASRGGETQFLRLAWRWELFQDSHSRRRVRCTC